MLNRRKFVGSVGAGLLLAPFVSLVNGDRPARAAGKKAKRLLLFCTMGTNPDMWSPTGVSAENKFTFSAMTQPLSAIKANTILIEGCPSMNVGDGHGSPDGLTGLGYGQVGQVPIISVDQFIAGALTASGINTPIPSFLLGADSTASGGKNMFYNGKNGSNCMSTIGSPMSAFTTAFGGALPTGMTTDSLLKRRKSILDMIMSEITGLQSTLGSTEKAKLDLHLDSIRQLENKLTQMSSGGGAACTKPATPPADSMFTPAETQTIAANVALQNIIMAAFACDITRVAAIHYGSDQKLQVNIPAQSLNDDQHGGFIHSGAASNYKNLVTFEQYLSTQFASMVTTLGMTPEADGSGMLLDNTIVAWCRDMGDSIVHNQQSMRFVLASGANGYLKTDPNGRYLDMRKMSAPANRHERVLL
ncbi:MAG TPA: DUF1552 domain-containing protein, partial [Polyangia bacterium]